MAMAALRAVTMAICSSTVPMGRIGTARGIQEATHSLGNEVTTLIGPIRPGLPKGVMETTICSTRLQ